MTDMTSEQYRELADLCGPTRINLDRIAVAWRKAAGGSATVGVVEVSDWLSTAASELREHAHYLQESEDAERQLREDIRSMTKAGEGHVDVDAIIRRVREADKG